MKVPAALGLLFLCCSILHAQAPVTPAPAIPSGVSLATMAAAQPAGDAYTFTFFNRPIVLLRAQVLGRRPVDRAAGAHQIVSELADHGITGPVASRTIDGVVFITVGQRAVLALTPADIDD